MRAHKSSDDVPHGTIPTAPPNLPDPITKTLKTAGHLAVWAVMYAIGVAVILGELLGYPLEWKAILYVTLCSHAGYVFDRIKFRDADLDPADLLADPGRHQFLRSHARWLRILMALEWIGAVVLGWMIAPMLGGLVLGGVLAGYAYSGWSPSDRSRLKDVSGLKAWLVSGAVVGLGFAVVLADAHVFGDVQNLRSALSGHRWWCVVGMLLIVCGDAVVCDLDDSTSDRVYRTRSLPVMIGDRWSGLLAIGFMVAGSGLILAGVSGMDAGAGSELAGMVIVFTVMCVVSGVLILRSGPMIGGRRDWIDGRMLAVVVAAVVLAG